MPANLSIKNVPDAVVQKLKERARRNHRSLQGELMAIIESAALETSPAAPLEVLAQVRKLGLATAADSAAIVRGDRDRH